MRSKTPHWIIGFFGIVVALVLVLTVVQQYRGKVESYKGGKGPSRSVSSGTISNRSYATSQSPSSASVATPSQPVNLNPQDQVVFSKIMNAAVKPFKR